MALAGCIRDIGFEEKRRRELRAEELERELELDTLSILGPSEQLSFAHRLRQYYAEHPSESKRYTGGPRRIRAEKPPPEVVRELERIIMFSVKNKDGLAAPAYPPLTSRTRHLGVASHLVQAPTLRKLPDDPRAELDLIPLQCTNLSRTTSSYRQSHMP